MAHGTLDFDAAGLPTDLPTEGQPTFPGTAREPTLVKARFKGLALDTRGFTIPFDQPVTIAATCLGPWCPAPQPGQDYLAFIARADDGYRIEVSPCPWALFQDPDSATLTRMQSCLTHGPCAPTSP